MGWSFDAMVDNQSMVNRRRHVLPPIVEVVPYCQVCDSELERVKRYGSHGIGSDVQNEQSVCIQAVVLGLSLQVHWCRRTDGVG